MRAIKFYWPTEFQTKLSQSCCYRQTNARLLFTKSNLHVLKCKVLCLGHNHPIWANVLCLCSDFVFYRSTIYPQFKKFRKTVFHTNLKHRNLLASDLENVQVTHGTFFKKIECKLKITQSIYKTKIKQTYLFTVSDRKRHSITFFCPSFLLLKGVILSPSLVLLKEALHTLLNSLQLLH